MSTSRDHIVRWRQWAVEQAIKTSPRSAYPDDVTRLAGQLLKWVLHESQEFVPPPIDSRICGNCDSPMPTGCSGQFVDQPSCLLFSPPQDEAATLPADPAQTASVVDTAEEPIDVGIIMAEGTRTRAMARGGRRYVARSYKLRAPVDKRHDLIVAFNAMVLDVAMDAIRNDYSCFWRRQPSITLAPASEGWLGVTEPHEAFLHASCRIFLDERYTPIVKPVDEGERTPWLDDPFVGQ